MAAGADILWRRLDRPGHDACNLRSEGSVWQIDGTAVWLGETGPARMSYAITCGEDWVTHSARIQGRVGRHELTFSIRRDELGNWRVNGEEMPEVARLRDLDLGFTPATNTPPIRRMMAERADRADITTAWLDTADWTLKPLPQSYAREGHGTWRYASQTGFRALLAVNGNGLVTDYEGLWVKEG